MDLWDRPLPGSCLRGLRNSDMARDDEVMLEAFLPNEKQPRVDGDFEASVNWEDDPGALKLTLASSNADFGAARLPTQAISQTSLLLHPHASVLRGERRPGEQNNPYHGNLVFPGQMKRLHRRQLASALALQAQLVRQDDATTVPSITGTPISRRPK